MLSLTVDYEGRVLHHIDIMECGRMSLHREINVHKFIKHRNSVITFPLHRSNIEHSAYFAEHTIFCLTNMVAVVKI